MLLTSSGCVLVCCRGWAREGSSDRVWQQFIAQWFRDNGVNSSFYWCLNPNSGDTGPPYTAETWLMQCFLFLVAPSWLQSEGGCRAYWNRPNCPQTLSYPLLMH